MRRLRNRRPYKSTSDRQGNNLVDLPLINDLLNQYLQEKMGITVQLVLPERNYHQSIPMDLLQGKRIDLAFCNDAEYLHDWIQNGGLHPLDQPFEEQGTDISRWIADEYMIRRTVQSTALATMWKEDAPSDLNTWQMMRRHAGLT